MNILLLGKNGQVGWDLQRYLAPIGSVTALDRHGPEHCRVLAELEGMVQTVRALLSEVIVNSAAHTAVDRAGSEPELTFRLNAEAPALLAREAQALGAWLVRYSTDYVFDGSGLRPWTETDAPALFNVYGKCTLEGERLIQQRNPRHLILRISWVYGARGSNFAKAMHKLAQEHDQLNVINDQIGAPTSTELLADVMLHIILRVRQQPDLAGLYHLVAAGETTWHGYAKHVLACAESRVVELKTKADAVLAVPTSAFLTPARRPHNSRHDISQLQAHFVLYSPLWQQGVERLMAEILLPRSWSPCDHAIPIPSLSTTHETAQRHHPRRWLRHPAASGHLGHQQVAPACL